MKVKESAMIMSDIICGYGVFRSREKDGRDTGRPCEEPVWAFCLRRRWFCGCGATYHCMSVADGYAIDLRFAHNTLW